MERHQNTRLTNSITGQRRITFPYKTFFLQKHGELSSIKEAFWEKIVKPVGEEGRRGENEFEGQQLTGHMRPTFAEWRLRTKFEKAREQKCFDEIFLRG